MKKTIMDYCGRIWRTRRPAVAVGLFVALGLCMLLFSRVSTIQAAQIKSVQTVTTASASSVSLSLTALPAAVDTTNSFILQYVEMGAVYTYETKKGGKGGEAFGLFTTLFEESAILNVSRLRADDISYAMDANVANTVVEFADGVRIFSGTASIGATVYQRNITLPQTIDLSKSIVVFMTKAGFLSKPAESEQWTFRGTFPDANTLRLERLKLPTSDTYYPAPTAIIQWQVIEFQSDAVVKRGTVTIPAAAASVTATLSPAITDINKAFLVFSYMGIGDIAGVKQDLLTRGTITNTTTLTFTRGNAATSPRTIDIAYYVVEMTDNSSLVQKGSTTLAAASLTGTATLGTAVDTTRAFPLVSTSVTGGTTLSLSDGWVKAALTAATTLSFSRLTSAIPTTIDWFVVELSPLKLTAPNDGEVWTVGSTQDITWKHANSLTSGGSCTATGYEGHHLVNLLLSKNGGTDGYPLTIASGVRGTADTYPWTILSTYSGTNVIGEQLKVKIIDTDMAARNFDVSDDVFIIKGTLTVSQPPNTWKLGETGNLISWNNTGDLNSLSPANMTIKISPDSGSNFYDITTAAVPGTGSGGTYNWNPIPSDLGGQNLIGTDNIVKLVLNYDPSAPDTTVTSTSTAFTLKGQISGVTPNSSVTWLLGETQPVTWQKKGHFGTGITEGTVDIYYSSNSGATYGFLPVLSGVNAGTDAVGGSTNWTIPSDTVVSNPTSKLKVVQTTDPSVYAESAEFYILPSLDIQRPVGAEIWRYGQSQDIKWTIHGTMDYVVIKYKVGAGDWQYVSGAAPTDFLDAGEPEVQRTFSWSVPDNLGNNNVYLRVCNRSNENVYDEVGPFSIKGAIAVNEPHLSELVKVTNAVAANKKFITWEPQGTMTGTASIKLSKDGGSSWPITLSTGIVNINAGSYEWTVLSTHQGTNCMIKVGLDGDDDATTGTAGLSSAFKVVPYLDLTYPDTTGLSFQVGSPVNITWTADPADFGTVDLRFDLNSGADGYEGFIADGVPSQNLGYTWPEIPDVAGIVGNKVRVKVFQTGKETDVYSASTYDFSVTGSIELTGESNGEGSPVWEVGTNQQITWTAVGDIHTVNIYYTTTGGEPYSNTVTTNVSAGSGGQVYLWQPIPDNVIANDRNTSIKFKVVFTGDNTIYSVSDNPVTIQGKLIITQPNGNETLSVDDPDDDTDSYNISWDTYGQISQVKLAYDTNSGNDGYLNTIASGQAISNVDGYDWQVPNAIGSKVRVKVMSANFPANISDTSDADFTIKGKIKVISPNTTDRVANAWKVDTAALPSSENIEWRNCGDLGGSSAVNIYYSDNGGTDYSLVTTASGASGLQSYNWTIPDTWSGRSTIGTDNKIKITQQGNESEVFAESDYFDIKGQLRIGTPAGGEVYYIGGVSPIDVTWDYAGQLGNIDIFFSSVGGTSWEETPRATIAVTTTQPYELTVPNVTTTQGKLKLEQVSNRTVQSATPDPGFAIKGTVILTYPDNAPTLVKKVGEDLNITWDLTGSIATVAIDYDTNSGNNNYPGVVIATTSAPAKGYTWTIPETSDVVSDYMRIRVRDTTDGTVQDSSSADFKIKPIIAITAPAGGEEWIVGELKTISWTTKGFAAGQQIKIEYSDDGGDTWPGTGTYVINAGIAASALKYDWSIPDTITLSSKCVIRLSKVGDTETSIDSNWFTIKGSINVTQPDGGVNLAINTGYTIKWSKAGNVGNCALYYSVDAAHNNWTAIVGAEALPAAQGSTGFSWTIPDSPSATVKVKVVPVTVGDPTTANVSDADNAIVGSIFVQTPDPDTGATMVVGSPYSISWTKFGSISAFDVFYSYDNKATWEQIGDNVTATSLSWTVLDHISTQVHFRIVDASNADVKAETTVASTIKGSIDLTAPDGAETLIVAQSFNVAWTKTGTIGNIKIEYSTDNFSSDIRTINASYPSGSSPYPWSAGINDITNTDNVKVRVTSLGGIPVTDVSQNPFKIIGKITNVQPSGSAVIWYKGESKSITWNQAGNISSVDIKYKTATADTFNKTIVTNDTGHADGANSYPCTVPDENSEDCWIQVLDHANADVNSASAAAFSIRPKITVTAPAGGASLVVGTGKPYTVDWSLNGSAKITTVNIAYSTNGAGGAFTNAIASSVDATLGTVNWSTVNDTLSDSCYVRVIDAINANVYGLSGAGTTAFSIVGSITVQAPNGSEDWTVGSSQNITWTKTGTIGNVNIYVDYGAGYLPTPLATVDTGVASLWAWNPIPDQVSNICKIKIVDADNSNVLDESNAAFHIVGGFTISKPDGSPLVSGDPYTLEWTPLGTAISKVKLEFYNGTEWSTIAALATNSGQYEWTVPSTTASTQCKIKITASDPVQTATAKESGTFWVHGKIDVTAPLSSAKWTVGTSENIVFNVTGKIDNVNIKYSKDGGLDGYAYTIVSGKAVVAGENTHSWSIPTDQNILSATGAKIKVVDAAYSTVYGVSADFMLKGTLSVLTPSADNIVMTYGGTPYNITWSAGGPVANVRIYYSTNDGSTYANEITTAAGVPVTPASYSWDIPNQIIGKHLKVKVVDKDNADAFAVSANTFEVVGQLLLTAPVGNEKWTVGSAHPITWTPTGTFSNVRVQASLNDFSTSILDTVQTASAGTYSWTIPDNISATVKVRVTDPDHHPELVKSESTNFSILGGLDLTVPEAGQLWYVGDTDKQITWDANGTVTNVKIEYKTSAGGTYQTIAANDGSHTSGPNTYAWSSGVADQNAETCYIRVSDVNNYTDVYSVGAAAFSIRPKITVSAPAAGTDIKVGSNNTDAVVWSLNGSSKVTTVDVLYSTNGAGGPFDKTIASGVDATLGKVSWNNVSDNISSNVVVKVVDTGNANVSGLSGVFNIVGSITVQAPNGSEDWTVGSSQNITWTKTGTIGNVNIYVDYGAGYLPTPLATVDTGVASLWAWNPIPDQVSNTCKIKIVDADNSTVLDESNAAFHIAASFTVNTPADGNVLVVDDSFDITWARVGTAVTTVKLEYSANGGTDWILINSASNSGIYPWTVPNAISTSCKVRVSDPNNATANDQSEGYFKIKGALQVTSPNAGTESWNVGSTYPITWTRNGSVSTINIYYSYDNGTNWVKLNTLAVDGSLGTWNWTISEAIQSSSSALIKIIDTSDSTVYDSSNNKFEVKGSLSLTTPSNAGIVLSVSDPYTISWTKYGAIANIEIHYSTNGGITGGGTYPNLIATVPASDLSYGWTVPDSVGTNLRIRVRAVDNTNVWDESDNTFGIKGKITVNQPDGGETLFVGDTAQIKWTPVGTYSQVRLEYSTNAFSDELQTHSIAAVSAGSSGVQQSYDWTVADAIGSNVKIRASDLNNSAVADVSNAVFSVKGKLQVTVPNGAEVWKVGEQRSITWNRTGSVANVKLEHSIDGGTSYAFVIVASTDASTGSYAWTLPDRIGLQNKIRVSDADDASVNDVSDANFTIKGKLTVTAPNGSEVWHVSQHESITWTKTGTIAAVKLEYSTNGFSDELKTVTIAGGVDAVSGTPYDWTIPDALSNTVKVRVTNEADDTVADVSDTNFKIAGGIIVTSPNGTEEWTVGATQSITWSLSGSIQNVKLEYSTDSGSTYPNTIIGSAPAAGLSYSWVGIPNSVSKQVRVRVADASDVSVFDVSNADFTIMPGFNLIVPNGGEVWTVDASQDITWTTTGTCSNVKLEYSTNSGANYTTIVASTANTETYAWTVPNAISTTCKTRISDVDNPTAVDITAGLFKIRGSLTLTSPNGLESWDVASKHNITWTRTGSIANVKLEYSTDGGATYPAGNLIIASTDASAGTYEWTIPDNLSTQIRVKVTDTSDSTVNDVSNANFTIKGALTLNTPNGGEEMVVGTAYNVTWTRFGSIQNVKLEYSVNAGQTYPNLIIAATDAAVQTYAWAVPDAIGTQVRVKVTDVDNALVLDASNADFTIKGSLVLNSPNGGEIWFVNENRNITWTRTGSIAIAKLEYSIDSGSNYSVVIAPTVDASLQTYTWTVADAIGSHLRVKITDTSNATVNDASNADFYIKGKVSVLSPNGTEVWVVGESKNITWSRTGSIANVQIAYSTDSGTSYPNTIIASTDAATGSYGWNVADAISSSLKVKISDAADTTVADESDAVFQIKGSLTLTSPVGSEAWIVGSSHAITWTKTGTINNVELRYSKNGGTSYDYVIAASVPGADLSYSWTIPDDICSTTKVKITNNADSSVYAVSNSNFKISGSLVLSSPNGGEEWTVGETKNITWTLNGSIANVKLEYSTDSGSTYPNTIIGSAPAAGLSYSWVGIPNSVSKQVRVRVADAGDPTVNDVSNADFTIMPGFNLTVPNGGEVWTVDASQDITWTTAGTCSNVKLEYSTNSGANYTTIVASTANTETYAWTVPNAISTTCKTRISDVDNPTAVDITAGLFKIRGSLTLTSPNGLESWDVESKHNITWTRTGSIANVKLEYSTDEGATYPAGNLIIASTDASAGTYEWTIPDNLSTQIRVKVTDTSDSTVNDVSNANFTIKGALTLNTPNGGEEMVVGTAYNVTWTRFGSIQNVKLEYSVNAGQTYPNLIIAATDAAVQTYAWAVPDAIGTQVRVKVTDVDNALVLDTSNADFSIKGALLLTAPNGGEVWYVGQTKNITWVRTGSIATVKLEYSTNAGSTYPVVVAPSVDASLQTYAWTVPDAISNQLKVKITDISNATVTDVSDAVFTVKGVLVLTAPNGGENWLVGNTQNITWNRTGSIANVKLEYSTTGGSTYANVIIASTDGSTGTYAWPIPDAIGSQLRVRITDVDDASVMDTSDANFIIRGKLLLTAPNGAESWGVATTQNITWTRTGSIATVKLEYSLDGGLTYPTVIAASTDGATGTYGWTIPDNPCPTVKVKVSDTTDSSVFDISNANFKIVGFLTLTAPNGGEKWGIETQQKITWSMVGSIANVKLEYSTNGGTSYDYLVIASTPGGGLEYYWTIPDAASTTARVKISDVSDISVFDTSNDNFRIQARFTLTQPNGGEVWSVGDAQDVIWTTVGSVENVKLDYSTDGGSTYPNTISASVSNTGTYAWTIPDAISATLRVRVADVNDDQAFDASNANFKIRGAVALTSPNGGESWIVNSQHAVTWTRNGSVSTVKLEYSTDSGATYPNTIIGSIDASLGTYNWTIPDKIGNAVKVKVTSTSDGTVFDASNSDFAIKGALTVTAPNGGEQWVVGAAANITWTRVGSIQNVKIEYSKNSGATFPYVMVASTDASTGLYGWDVDDVISSTLRVKVSDAADATVSDISDADFSIKGALTLTSPNGGEIWYVGQSKNVTWSRTGSIPAVKLEYSTNGGTSYATVIIASTDAAAGSFAWPVPDSIGSALKVKITDTANATVTDVSDDNFTIKGVLQLTSPNGGETWVVNDSQNITWTPTGTITAVKLEYSTDGGNTYPALIIASTDGPSGTYSWTVADAIGTNLKVKVSDAADSSVADVSDAVFTVKGSLRITAPNGGESWGVGTTHAITWVRKGSISTATLQYSADGGASYPNTITTTADAATQSANWTIPDSLTSQGKVKIINNADSSVNDTSDLNFKIVGILTITAPNGGESWGVETIHNITWTRVGSIANVRLDYSTDSGTTYPSMIIASANAGSLGYAWTLPDAVSKTVRVKISDAAEPSVSDTSDANFSVLARFDITAPDGGEVWTVASSHDITWTNIGSITSVVLEYSTDGGATFPITITAQTDNTGSYPWTIPDAISSQVRVRVSDYNNSNAFGISAANAKIRGSITVTSPNGSEAWIVGSSHAVTWSIVGSIATVKIDYSEDSGSTYPYTITAAVSAASGTHSWTIPDTLTQTAKVKITNTADSTVYDVSDAVFKIRGSLAVTSPNGSEVWKVGDTEDITWTRNGSIASVKLEYSTNGGITYPGTIAASVDAYTGIYPWTVSDAISTQVKVRVSDVLDSTVNDASDSNFKIQGVITLTSPNGAEQWEVGTSHAITWDLNGSIANLKLDYSVNNGTDNYPYAIVGSVNAALKTYAWTVPDSLSDQVKVKATNLADTTVFDVSNNTFRIVGKLVVVAPNGGEVWPVGTAQSIIWSRVGSIASVKLEFSTDGGVTYPNIIVSSTAASALSYNWTIPDAIYSTLRVKISDVADATVFDVSDANFKIRGNLNLTAPLGAEIWMINTSHNITWARFGSIANVRLEYSIDSGSSYPYVIVGSMNAGLQTYAWSIPDNPSTHSRVKITDAADATVFDASDANFIIRGGFTLSSPNGAEVWAINSIQNILWTTFGSIANVKLEYTKDNGTSWNLITASTTNTGAYAWTIPDSISTQCKVKISDSSDVDATDTSDAVFKIHGILVITSPNGAEEWNVGSTHNITWTKVGSISNAKLEYSNNGFSDETHTVVITAATSAASLSYAWTIPDAISTNVKVRISDSNDAAVTDLSDGVFKIRGAFTLNSPNGSESWIVASAHAITWTTQGTVTNVKLDYSINAGSTWTVIIASVANAGTYNWTVPDTISDQVRVKVTDVTDSSAYDASDNNFKIRGDLTITAPNGAEKWSVGTSQVITWSRVGSIASVKLEYSDNGGTTYVPIVDSVSNTGSYSWTVPDAITTQAMVRITNVADPTVTDASNAAFKIQGSFNLTSPNSGEAWVVGTAHDITWSWNGAVNYVNLHYSMDSGSTYPFLIVSNRANNGVYAWTVPDSVSGTVRVRVSDASDSEANDVSNGDFRIRCVFVLTAPNGAEQWRVGLSKDIKWTSTGTIPAVKLQYSRDNFVTDIQTITIGAPSTASYAWTIPDAISDTVRVRISDPNDIGAYDDSNADFRITADFTLTSPNGAEKWDVDSTQNITWSSSGSVSDVKLEYSVDGGATYKLIAATTNNGTYSWQVPDDISAQFKVRVSDLADPTANDASNANAKIRAKFTIIAPNGGSGQQLTVGENYDITWSCVGTVANVKLDYSSDDFVTPITIISPTANDGSYTWKVPNFPNATKVRVMSSTDVDAYDASDANFEIVRGILLVTSPNGGENWVTRETHAITWQTMSGSIPLVNIDYSQDGFVSNVIAIATNISNTVSPNSYTWMVPDDRSTTVKVRVSDVRDVTVNDISDSNFTIQYYAVTFVLKDLLTNQQLAQLTVDGSSDKGDTWKTSENPQVPGVPLSSPTTVQLPYGFWSFIWSKTGYGDKEVSILVNKDNPLSGTENETIYMETSAVHIWSASSEFTYDVANDQLKVTSWLERDGSVVTGAVQVDVRIYDDEANLLKTLTSTTPSEAGFFNQVWNSTGLESGRVYSTVTVISNASGAEFKTPSTFSITEAQQLVNTQAAVEQLATVTLPTFQSEVQSTINTGMATQQALIEKKMNEQVEIITTKTDEMKTSVDQTLTSFETRSNKAIDQLQKGADQATTAGAELETIAKRQSGELILPTSVLVGDTVEIRYRISTQLMPLMDIIAYDGTILRKNQPLIESGTTAGLYGYDLVVDATMFKAGKAFTVMVSESTTGNLQAGSVMVEATSLTSIEGLASGIPQLKSVTDKALDAIQNVEGTLATGGDVGMALTSLQESLAEIPQLLEESGPDDKMIGTINTIAERLQSLAGDQGFDISAMVESALSSSPTITEIKKKTENIKGIVEFLQNLFERKLGGSEDEPVVSTSLSTGSLVVNVIAANPSSTKPQTTRVKVYLPKEVTPKDIMDAGGLEVEFDANQSIYYVFKNNIELAPKEVRVFKVEIEDIWIIPQTTLDILKLRAMKIAAALEATEYKQVSEQLMQKLYLAVDEVVKSQNNVALSREQHIGAYRTNIVNLDRLKAELTDMEKLLIKKPEERLLTKAMTWKIITMVIIFIVLLTAVFFFTWYRKSSPGKDEIEKAKQFSFSDGKNKDEPGKPENKK